MLGQETLGLVADEIGDDLTALTLDGKKKDEMEAFFWEGRGIRQNIRQARIWRFCNTLVIKSLDMIAKYLDRPEECWEKAEERLPPVGCVWREQSFGPSNIIIV
jgi:hypothetical protein